jgi:hypothetical protein
MEEELLVSFTFQRFEETISPPIMLKMIRERKNITKVMKKTFI